MPTTDAQGRTISDDGYYWWDGTAWQLIQKPAGKSFLDSVADSVDAAVSKVETNQGGGPVVSVGSSEPAATPGGAGVAPAAATTSEVTPTSASQATPAVPVIPEADLHAYLGALKVTGVVTEAEFADITQRIRARG
jgi:hypothetical protein